MIFKMNNVKWILLTAISVLVLIGCGENEQSIVETEIESTSDVVYVEDTVESEKFTEESSKLLMTITSNGESVYPYLHLAYDREWDETGFLYSDGADPTTALQDISMEGITLPQLKYAEDFNVFLENNVEMKYGFLYDETMQQLDNDWDAAKVSELDKGVYYIGLLVNEEGKFIEVVQEYEYTGWVCFFQLDVN